MRAEKADGMEATETRRTPSLVHICGFPSSGTDLLSNFMSAHPDIDVRGEFPMLHKLADTLRPMVPPEQVGKVVRMLRSGDVYGGFRGPDPSLTELEWMDGQITVGSVYAALLTRRAVRWCGNKTPQNTENMAALLRLFPESRIVFISRDIRDVCLSWNHKWGKDMRLCASKWNHRMQLGWQIMEQLPAGQVLKLRFEDLTADPEGVGRSISAFLGIPDSDNFAAYQAHVSRVVDGKRNFGAAINPANQGKWKHQIDRATVRRIEEIALPAMQLMGYRPEHAVTARDLSLSELLKGAVGDAYATLAVGNRYKSRNRLRDRLRKAAIVVRYRIPSLRPGRPVKLRQPSASMAGRLHRKSR